MAKESSQKIYRWREKHRALVDALKNVPCIDCRLTYPPYVMDFDHRGEEEKSFNISKVYRNPVSKERLLAEIRKCDLICANCHRERTFQRSNNPV